jgi:hypothetical protein
MQKKEHLNLQNESFPVFLERLVGINRIPRVVNIEVVGKVHQEPVRKKTESAIFLLSEIEANPLHDALPLNLRHQSDPRFFVRAGRYLHHPIHEHCASDTEYDRPLHDVSIRCTENKE